MEKKNLEIKPSTIAGNGLFALEEFGKNQLITFIEHPKIVVESELDFLKEDAAIQIQGHFKGKKEKIWITDASDDSFWYFQNHATKKANAIMKKMILSSGEITIGWFAKRKIEKSEEILFNYNPGYTVTFS